MLNFINKGFFLPKWMLGISGLVLTLVIAGVWLWEPMDMDGLSFQCFDYYLAKHHRSEKSDIPVIVDIDEESLKQYGQWPWPRYKIASMLKRIAESGPIIIGMDIVFSEPDRTSPKRILDELKEELGRKVRISGIPNRFMDNDQLMAEAMKNSGIVLGSYGMFDTKDQISLQHLQGPNAETVRKMTMTTVSAASISVGKERGLFIGNAGLGKNAGLTALSKATAIISPIHALKQAAAGVGFINACPASDGILRQMPLLIDYHGNLYPSLSLALIQAIRNDSLLLIRPNMEGAQVAGVNLIFAPNTSKRNSPGHPKKQKGGNVGKDETFHSIHAAFDSSKALTIPLDSSGNMLIHYRGKGVIYPTHSAADVMGNKISPNVFKNKIVFVGSSASGLKDLHLAPFDSEISGVEAQAAVIDTVLTGDYIRIPPWEKAAQVLLILCVGILITLFSVYGRLWRTLLVVVVLSVGSFAGSEYYFSQTLLFVSPIPPLVTTICTFFVLTVLSMLSTERDKAFLKNAFSKFVAKPIVDKVVSSPGSLKLQGEDKKLSILFADIRDFTALSENLKPDEVTQMLQEYFTPMTRVITRNNGTLDKFIGDGIMAFWNAPLDIAGHERWAFTSAVGMLTALGELNKSFSQKYGFEINIGIGLHAGVVRVGNMGTEDLFNYTIIGDDVNVASRLENLSKFYGVRIIISEGMVPYVPITHWVQDLDLVQVKGREKPLKIYGLFSGKFLEKPKKHIDEYHAAIDFYRERKFEEAQKIFLKFQDKKYDRPLYRIYRERCEYFLEHPPDENWDGVFRHKTKM